MASRDHSISPRQPVRTVSPGARRPVCPACCRPAGLWRLAGLGRAQRIGRRRSLGRLGALEVRLAQTAAEVRQAQKLRYRVFYQEGSAHRRSGPTVRAPRRRCATTRSAITCWCSIMPRRPAHAQAGRPWSAPTGCCARQLAEDYGGFYTAGEFDIGALIARHRNLQFPRARPLLRAGALSQQAHGRAAVARHLGLRDCRTAST